MGVGGRVVRVGDWVGGVVHAPYHRKRPCARPTILGLGFSCATCASPLLLELTKICPCGLWLQTENSAPQPAALEIRPRTRPQRACVPNGILQTWNAPAVQSLPAKRPRAMWSIDTPILPYALRHAGGAPERTVPPSPPAKRIRAACPHGGPLLPENWGETGHHAGSGNLGRPPKAASLHSRVGAASPSDEYEATAPKRKRPVSRSCACLACDLCVPDPPRTVGCPALVHAHVFARAALCLARRARTRVLSAYVSARLYTAVRHRHGPHTVVACTLTPLSRPISVRPILVRAGAASGGVPVASARGGGERGARWLID